VSSAYIEREQRFLDEHEPDAPASAPSRGAELRRIANLTWTLAVTDWKLRFYGSALGILWTLVRPFAYFGVIYFVFTEIASLDKDVHNYGIYILFALVLFTFFGEITSNSVQALVARENLLRKMRFNPIVIPLSITVTALLNLGMTLIAVFIFVFAHGEWPTWGWLELPVLIALIAILATGTGMLLSTLYVRYRDIQPIWEVFLQILFYGSTVLYVATSVPDQYQRLLLLNPIAATFAQMRHAVVDPQAPSITHLFANDARVLIPIALIFAIFALGSWYFQRESPRVAENL
jgi:ABC-2 type transport system permease protein